MPATIATLFPPSWLELSSPTRPAVSVATTSYAQLYLIGLFDCLFDLIIDFDYWLFWLGFLLFKTNFYNFNIFSFFMI
jgi:hypothetical protein